MGHKAHIYVCDLMYHKLSVLFHLASHRGHTISFLQALDNFYNSFMTQETHMAINQMYIQCLNFSNL